MRCQCCHELVTLSACEIRGLVGDNVMVNCPACNTTFVMPAPGPVSECFRMLHGLAEQIGQLQTFEEARMALEFIGDGAASEIDRQFVQCLRTRMDRKEKSLKGAA